MEIDRDACMQSIRMLMETCLLETPLAPSVGRVVEPLTSGKMLRGMLVFYIGSAADTRQDHILASAAAVEMIHAASLLHDDVIDGGKLRRGAPAFWREHGTQGAILVGDMLLFKALELIKAVNDDRLLLDLIDLTGEVCLAEVEQEMVLRGAPTDMKTVESIARRKTGPLFAFAASAPFSGNDAQYAALREAGYGLGTAYQLADDCFDRFGRADEADKTLGTDVGRNKPTAVNGSGGDRRQQTEQRIRELLSGAEHALKPFPETAAAYVRYIEEIASEAFDRFMAVAQ